MRDGGEGVPVWSVDERQRLVPAPITKVFASGTKEVYRLRLASGREVKASANHPFLTFSGWTPLEELRPGERLAIPRHVPEPINAGLGWSDYRIGLLAHLIGDGCVVRSAARALHLERRGEPGLRRGCGSGGVRHIAASGRAEDMVAHLPARAVPLHAWPREPVARLVPRTRDRRPAVAREAPSGRHLLGQRCRDLPVPAAPVGHRRLCLAWKRQVSGEGVLRHVEPPTRLRRCASARAAEDSRTYPAGAEGWLPARLPRSSWPTLPACGSSANVSASMADAASWRTGWLSLWKDGSSTRTWTRSRSASGT